VWHSSERCNRGKARAGHGTNIVEQESVMDVRNRIGLYGSYFLGMSGIGFTLPYLPLYLAQEGLSDRVIGIICTLAALAGLAQYPVGLWSDRLGRRKPFLVGALALLALATVVLYHASGLLLLAILVVLFAENGICRAIVESLAGAEATHLARPGQVGAALGALRFWKPISIVLVALVGGFVAENLSIAAILPPLAVIQVLAVLAALLIHENQANTPSRHAGLPSPNGTPTKSVQTCFRDRTLWMFVAAMVLFHVANAPGGVYLGLFLKRDLGAPDRFLSYAFIVSMAAWMLVIRPIGGWADRLGRRPLLIAGWATMTVRLVLVALADTAWHVLAIQVLDGVAQAFFAVVAAAWVTDRLADSRRVGEAQVLVGTSLVFGSALGPLLAGWIVEGLGYRSMFGLLGVIGAAATSLVVLFIPETVVAKARDLKDAGFASAGQVQKKPIGVKP
jgi:MFS family permease